MSTLKKIGGILSSLQGGGNGLISLIKDKTGKISFKRSLPIAILTLVVVPDIAEHGLTYTNLGFTAVAGAIYVLPKLIGKDSE